MTARCVAWLCIGGCHRGTLVGAAPNLEEQVQSTSQILADNGLVKSGERYVMVYGARVGVRGATNAVRVEQLP